MLGVAVLYFLLALGSLRFLASAGLSALLWPAAGLAVAATLLFGRRVLPGVFLGSAAANALWLMSAGVGGSVLWSTPLAIGVGAVTQAAVAAALVERVRQRSADWTKARSVMTTMFVMGPLSCTVAATIGTATQVLNDVVGDDQWGYVWFGWWLGDALGTVLFEPFFMVLLAPSNARFVGRQLKIAAPSLFLAIVVFVAITQMLQAERRSTKSELAAFANDAVIALEEDLTRHEEVLVGLRSLFEAAPELGAAGFRIYVDNFIDRFPTLQAVSWNPVIKGHDLDGFVESQRTQSGLEDFTVTERAADGTLVPVGDRDEYVVVAYIEPLATNRAALGFDIASNPSRLTTIEEARSTGRITATEPITLVQGDSQQPGMLVLLPTYRGDGGGISDVDAFMVGVYRFGDLVDSVFLDSRWDVVNIELIDVTGDRLPLAASPARTEIAFDAVIGSTEPHTIDMEWFGRHWEFVVTPVSGPLAQAYRSLPFEPLLALLAIVLLLESFVLVLADDEQAARRRAEEMTFAATHDSLTALLNRTGFANASEKALSTSDECILFVCDLDRFKTVNDTGGHEAGDEVLRSVAEAMLSAVRTCDIVARLGGDEFAVLLVDCPLDAAHEIARGLITKISETRVETESGTFSVGVSAGLTKLGPEGLAIALQEADAASYVSKQNGGNSVRLATASMNE